MSCIVQSCKALRKQGKSLFRLPENVVDRNQWLLALRRPDLIGRIRYRHLHVCQDHFSSNCFRRSNRSKGHRKDLLPGVEPSLPPLDEPPQNTSLQRCAVHGDVFKDTCSCCGENRVVKHGITDGSGRPSRCTSPVHIQIGECYTIPGTGTEDSAVRRSCPAEDNDSFVDEDEDSDHTESLFIKKSKKFAGHHSSLDEENVVEDNDCLGDEDEDSDHTGSLFMHTYAWSGEMKSHHKRDRSKFRQSGTRSIGVQVDMEYPETVERVNFKCNETGCLFRTVSHQMLIEHLKEEHDLDIDLTTRTFETLNDFDVWKDQKERKESRSCFRLNREQMLHEAEEVMAYYTCNRSGYYDDDGGGGICEGKRKRPFKRQRWTRVNAGCTAFIKVIENKDTDCVTAIYSFSHHGHEETDRDDVESTISKKPKIFITGEPKSGVTSNHVLRDRPSSNSGRRQIRVWMWVDERC